MRTSRKFFLVKSSFGKAIVRLTLSVYGPVRQVAYDPAPGVRVFVVAGLPPGQSGVGGDGWGEKKKIIVIKYYSGRIA